jgi:phospholipid-transporting ATPase
MEKVALEIEHSFEISGSTAIEDRLQDGVADAIIHIRKAGIKLWVLTGDKIETAINIGYSSGLLDDYTSKYAIDATNSFDIFMQLCIAENNMGQYIGKKQIAIIVAGDSLLKIMARSILTEKFIEVIDKSNVVLACRVSPKQKAEIVNLIRAQHKNAKTLAIGDGANDVNMITAAHVGIGISGLEG